ncbi:MAG: tetratricopeptide repeat protein [Aureliella sp.]
MKNRIQWPTLAIVVATFAIAFAPVFVPREVSRWYLAAAGNAFRAGDDALAERYLSRAADWDSSIVDDGDYLVAQLWKTHGQSADGQLDLLERIVRSNPRWAPKAKEIAELLAEESDFQRAVRALKISLQGGPPRSPNDLNLLAYFRALAGIELEAALKDIDQAIELVGREPGLLDTKAWVLHGLRRDLEALPIINEAVQGVERLLRIDDKASAKTETGIKAETGAKTEPGGETESESRTEAEAERETENPFDPSGLWPDLDDAHARIAAAKKKLGTELWTLAVLRFHRMRIYEAVGGRPEAREDRRWLREHQVPITDEIF